MSWRQISSEETYFYNYDYGTFLTTLGPLSPFVVSLPTCFVNKNEPSINQASHLPKGYYLQVNTHRSVSFNGSRNAFLLPSNGESDSPFALMFEVDKIRMPVEEAKRNTNVPWLSTLFILMVICFFNGHMLYAFNGHMLLMVICFHIFCIYTSCSHVPLKCGYNYPP